MNQELISVFGTERVCGQAYPWERVLRSRLSGSNEIIELLTRVRGRQVFQRSTAEADLFLEVKTARAAWILERGDRAVQPHAEICLGFWPDLDLPTAVALAQRTKAHYTELGRVPPPLVQELFERYRAEKLDRMPSGATAARSLRHVLRPFYRQDVHQLSMQDLQKELAAVAERSPHHAARCRAYLHAFFGWAQEAGLLDDNPARSLPRFASEARNRRKLSLAELVEIWQAAEALPAAQAAALRLNLLLPVHRDEIRALAWSDLEWAEEGLVWWRMTSKDKQDGRPRQPWLLPDAAFAILSARAASSGGEGSLVFNGCGADGPDWSWAECKRRLSAELSKRRAAAGLAAMPAWHFEDVPPSFELCVVEALDADPALAALCRGKMSPFRSPEAQQWAQSSDARDAASELLQRWVELLLDLQQ